MTRTWALHLEELPVRGEQPFLPLEASGHRIEGGPLRSEELAPRTKGVALRSEGCSLGRRGFLLEPMDHLLRSMTWRFVRRSWLTDRRACLLEGKDRLLRSIRQVMRVKGLAPWDRGGSPSVGRARSSARGTSSFDGSGASSTPWSTSSTSGTRASGRWPRPCERGTASVFGGSSPRGRRGP